MPNELKPLPKLSVITVVRNAREAMEGTIQSVARQTYPHIEYIVVDGASTDGTLELIGKHRSCIHTLVSEPDKGLYDAMNKGMALATGNYLCFLNAGDRFHTDNTLWLAVHSFADNASLPDVVYGQTAIVDEKGKVIRMRRLSAPETLDWRSFRDGMLVCHQAFFAKRTLAEPYDLRYRFSADFDWCIRIMKQSSVLHNTHLTLIDSLGVGGVTRRNRIASLIERFGIMAKYYGRAATVNRHLWFVIRLFYQRYEVTD